MSDMHHIPELRGWSRLVPHNKFDHGFCLGSMFALFLMACAMTVGGCTSGPSGHEQIQTQLEERDATYYWTDEGIRTSDGRFFRLTRKNIRDKDGNRIIIMEAREVGNSNAAKLPPRKEMTEKQLTIDIWLRIQDQELETFQLIPSRFDNDGDLRKTLVTITKEEAEYLKLDDIEQYRLRHGVYDKIAVPLWIILQKQEEIQKAPIKKEFQDKVKKLRESEIPSA